MFVVVVVVLYQSNRDDDVDNNNKKRARLVEKTHVPRIQPYILQEVFGFRYIVPIWVRRQSLLDHLK